MKLHEGKYLHGEAFMLMKYQSEDRSTEEMLWNSRDGVTPFILHSVDGVEMSHVNWQNDYREPGHIPEVGTRMFIDLTKEKMLDYKRTLVERAWDDEKYPLKEYEEMEVLGKAGAAYKLAYSEWQDGQPDIVVVTQKIRDEIGTARARALLPNRDSRRNPPRAG